MDPHISEQWANWGQFALACIGTLLFAGNEARSWFTQDGLSLSRVCAFVAFRLFGSWPAKIEVIQVYGRPIGTQRFTYGAELRMKVRSPHPVVFQNLSMEVEGEDELIPLHKDEYRDTANPRSTHIVDAAAWDLVSSDGQWPPKPDRIRFVITAGGRVVFSKWTDITVSIPPDEDEDGTIGEADL